jgi:hypothetical protein
MTRGVEEACELRRRRHTEERGRGGCAHHRRRPRCRCSRRRESTRRIRRPTPRERSTMDASRTSRRCCVLSGRAKSRYYWAAYQMSSCEATRSSPTTTNFHLTACRGRRRTMTAARSRTPRAGDAAAASLRAVAVGCCSSGFGRCVETKIKHKTHLHRRGSCSTRRVVGVVDFSCRVHQ